MKTVCLSLDDWSVVNNNLYNLELIKDHYPNFKVSLFAIPVDIVNEKTIIARTQREEALKRIKKNLDWMEIIPHGLFHLPKEMEKCDYYTFRDLVIPSIDEAFKKDGLPYQKGFKAPYWLWNKDVVRVLDELGWWGAVDRNQPTMDTPKKFYRYSHSITEPYSMSNNEVLKLHGHVDGVSDNDLDKCLLQIFKLPEDTEWKFVSEMVEEK